MEQRLTAATNQAYGKLLCNIHTIKLRILRRIAVPVTNQIETKRDTNVQRKPDSKILNCTELTSLWRLCGGFCTHKATFPVHVFQGYFLLHCPRLSRTRQEDFELTIAATGRCFLYDAVNLRFPRPNKKFVKKKKKYNKHNFQLCLFGISVDSLRPTAYWLPAVNSLLHGSSSRQLCSAP